MQPAQARPGLTWGLGNSDYVGRIIQRPFTVKPQNVAAT